MYALDEKIHPPELDQVKDIITVVFKLCVGMETYCFLLTSQHYQIGNSIMVMGNYPHNTLHIAPLQAGHRNV